MMKKRINKLPKHIFFITIIGTLLVLCSIFPVSKTITKIMMTSKNYEEPANNAFTDQNFYNCVVDAYNKKNPDDHKEYTDNLTDEELQTIVTLSCLGSGKSDNEKITDTTGLEKLSNITSLDLRNNKLSNIDLSNNIYLTFLSLGSNQLFSIDVKHNTNLTQLYLSSNQITEIDVNQNTKLTYLDLRDNNLNKIDVITNIELLYLDLGWNKITNINVSTNKELKVLDLQYNDLSSIDVDTNKNLTSLDLSHNELTDIDVRNNKELGVLDLRNNQLSVADLTSNTKLYHLYLNDNQLTTVDLSSNQLLTALDLSNNQLVAIDVTQNTKLTDLSLEHNNLSSIDLSKNTKLTRLDLQDNPFAVNISIYKDEEKKLTTDLGCVKLPEGKTSTWTKITNFNNMNMDDNIVSANAGGLYKVKVDYRHNVVPYTPYGADTYSITYNIYVIETTSSKYTIGEDYIYVGTETDNETIINNIE